MFTVKRFAVEERILIHNNDICIGCGLCVSTCPTTSLKLGPIVPIARGIIDMEKVSINKSSCVLCGICSTTCPFNAMSLKIDDEDIKDLDSYPKWTISANINQEECIYCGRCKSVCPQDAILFTRTLPKKEDLVRGTIEINDEKCIYCNVCAEMCPSQAIAIDVDKKIISLNKSQCVYCGICKRVCSQNAIVGVCTTCMETDYIKIPAIKGEAYIIEDYCVNCSWCVEICPQDCISVIKPFDGTIKLIESEDNKCKGQACHACRDVCCCNAVEIIDNIAVTNPIFCNLCGACVYACPQHIRNIQRDSMKLTNITSSSWCKNLDKILD